MESWCCRRATASSKWSEAPGVPVSNSSCLTSCRYEVACLMYPFDAGLLVKYPMQHNHYEKRESSNGVSVLAVGNLSLLYTCNKGRPKQTKLLGWTELPWSHTDGWPVDHTREKPLPLSFKIGKTSLLGWQGDIANIHAKLEDTQHTTAMLHLQIAVLLF